MPATTPEPKDSMTRSHRQPDRPASPVGGDPDAHSGKPPDLPPWRFSRTDWSGAEVAQTADPNLKEENRRKQCGPSAAAGPGPVRSADHIPFKGNLFESPARSPDVPSNRWPSAPQGKLSA